MLESPENSALQGKRLQISSPAKQKCCLSPHICNFCSDLRSKFLPPLEQNLLQGAAVGHRCSNLFGPRTRNRDRTRTTGVPTIEAARRPPPRFLGSGLRSPPRFLSLE